MSAERSSVRESAGSALMTATVASVTAAPKPMTACLCPEVVSSMLRLHVDESPGVPAPDTGASHVLTLYFLSEDEMYAVAAASTEADAAAMEVL